MCYKISRYKDVVFWFFLLLKLIIVLFFINLNECLFVVYLEIIDLCEDLEMLF